MQTVGVDSLNHTFEKTHIWLRELSEEAGLLSEAQAYSILRAVLQTLRDRLTIDECAHLASHLPMLLRGVYYEGWKPARNPVKHRSVEEFLAAIADRLGNSAVDPEHGCRAVFRFLDSKINRGELDDVRHMLPAEIRGLWGPSSSPPGAGRRF